MSRGLQGFIGRAQASVIAQALRGEEGAWFADRQLELEVRIQEMPVMYETDGQGDAAIAQLHYFTAGADWWITERDVEHEQLQAFGLADLGHGGELGYISLVEILAAGAELDLHWTPTTIGALRARRAA